MEPAERVDVIVDFRQFGVGSKVILHNPVGEPSTSAVMRFDVVRGGAEEARIPKLMREEEELPEVNAERSWPLTFQGLAGGGSVWQIGGGGFSEMRIDCRPRQGSTELWTWRNLSNRTHPMHMHGYHFKIVSMNGKPPHPGDAGWKDTVAVYPNETVVVRPYFDYFPGVYVFHCHAAEHGDMSMMGQMEVVGMIRRLFIARWLAFALLPRRPPRPRSRAPSRPTTRRPSAPSGGRTRCRRRSATRSQWRLTQPGNANAATHDIWLVPPGTPSRSTARASATRCRPRAPVMDTAGTYQFYCSIHGGLTPGGMNGVVNVGTTDPGPPVDPGTRTSRGRPARSRPTRNALLNDTTAPTVFEEGDNIPPRSSCSRPQPTEKGARARVEVEEPVSSPCASRRARRSSPPSASTVEAPGKLNINVNLPKRLQDQGGAVPARRSGRPTAWTSTPRSARPGSTSSPRRAKFGD